MDFDTKCIILSIVVAIIILVIVVIYNIVMKEDKPKETIIRCMRPMI